MTLRRLVKRLGAGRSTTAFELHVPQFDAHRGEFVAIVGESGCGKSTLLDILALVSRPTASDAFTLGDPPCDLRRIWGARDHGRLARLRAARFGYVLQTGGLLPFLTVEDNILLPLRILGLPPDRARVREMAARFGIDRELAKMPQTLSGGERQRAAILRALVHDPAIFLADEPTAAVDRARAVRIVADIEGLARASGTTVVMVTHDIELVRGRADRIYGFTVDAGGDGVVRSRCARVEAPADRPS
ncbi:putative ABC transport system ATP-binding protein [Azospirillum agricola]|uniref:ABC transporter ATP-binding protein n=1 Tax=Azospirillum agricola TaxID=1720247 RepID=UPI001AE5378D|nr:ATP-binding cassette domain-containing protein [Azospirillum agricola]MBP2227670.1 putative ABC transport system ATP-binding protein [Azospirillum agricola]